MGRTLSSGKIGHHPTWKNGIAIASLPGIAAMYPHSFAKEYGNDIPSVFMATGDKAESLESTCRWWDLLPAEGTKKEKVMIAGATHTQCSYKQDLICESCVKMDSFFRKYF